MTKKIKIYTDGSCTHKDLKKLGKWGPGGWGVAILDQNDNVNTTLKGGKDWDHKQPNGINCRH